MSRSSFILSPDISLYFLPPVETMGHYSESPKSKAKNFEEKQSPMSARSLYAGVTPPPSYQSFEGLWAHRASRPMASDGREVHATPGRQGMYLQHPVSRNEELMVNRRPRADRQKHHPPRRSSSSHNSSWTAKLIFQGLRSNLFGSGGAEQLSQESRERPASSRRTKLDFSTACREMHNHYTIHNHWQNPSLDEHISRTRTWPADGSARNAHDAFADFMGEGHPTFGFDAYGAGQRVAGQPSYHDHPTLLDNFVSGFSTSRREEFDPNSWLKDLFDDFPHHPAQSASYAQGTHDPWSHYWEAERKLAQDTMSGSGRSGPEHVTNREPAPRTPFARNEFRGHEHEKHPSSDRAKQSSNSPRPEDRIPDAASELAAYNKRWDYIDTIQQPHPGELPWPIIRHDVPFDHMKCDVFSFFARASGLQPERSKAPKLDFKLSPRSPYPSFDQHHQERERKMLKTFKQQMQREKLRWHEDKLRRKFPAVMGWDDERRKAVWAAIAEGSAVCDKRLANML
jgi:hypothetical protein